MFFLTTLWYRRGGLVSRKLREGVRVSASQRRCEALGGEGCIRQEPRHWSLQCGLSSKGRLVLAAMTHELTVFIEERHDFTALAVVVVVIVVVVVVIVVEEVCISSSSSEAKYW